MSQTVIIADDHAFTRDGMRRALDAVPHLTVVASASNGIEAISIIKKLKPHCAVLDLSMPGANGLEVFLDSKRWSPETRYVIVTGWSAANLFKKLDDAGVDGLFVKATDPQIITDGIIRVCAGERVISEAAQKEIDSVQQNQDLSKRELEVLQNLAKGKTNREMAADFGVSPKTIDTHRTNLLRKRNVNSTAELLVKAIQTGELDV